MPQSGGATFNFSIASIPFYTLTNSVQGFHIFHILALICFLWVMFVIHLEQCLAHSKTLTKISCYYLVIQRPLFLPFFAATVEIGKADFSACDTSEAHF